MDLDDLRRWFAEHDHEWQEPARVESCALAHHRLTWNYYSDTRRAGAANVEPWEGASLPGVLMVVGEAFLRGIDAKEGHPTRYRRRLRAITTDAGDVAEAWVYAVEPAFLRSYHTAPSPSYIHLMLRAARRHSFPAEYVVELEALLENADER